MALAEYPVKGNEAELACYVVRIVGHATPGSASIVAGTGTGVTLSYTATGIYTLTLGESLGQFRRFG